MARSSQSLALAAFMALLGGCSSGASAKTYTADQASCLVLGAVLRETNQSFARAQQGDAHAEDPRLSEESAGVKSAVADLMSTDPLAVAGSAPASEINRTAAVMAAGHTRPEDLRGYGDALGRVVEGCKAAGHPIPGAAL